MHKIPTFWVLSWIVHAPDRIFFQIMYIMIGLEKTKMEISTYVRKNLLERSKNEFLGRFKEYLQNFKNSQSSTYFLKALSTYFWRMC